MKRLVEKILIGAVILATVPTLLALLSFFASISAGSWSPAWADTLTKAASALFAFSRIGVFVAVVLGLIYVALTIDLATLLNGEASSNANNQGAAPMPHGAAKPASEGEAQEAARGERGKGGVHDQRFPD